MKNCPVGGVVFTDPGGSQSCPVWPIVVTAAVGFLLFRGGVLPAVPFDVRGVGTAETHRTLFELGRWLQSKPTCLSCYCRIGNTAQPLQSWTVIHLPARVTHRLRPFVHRPHLDLARPGSSRSAQARLVIDGGSGTHQQRLVRQTKL
jgi:hypothetical protein